MSYVTLSIPSEFGYEKYVMTVATQLARRQGFQGEYLDVLSMLIAESVINAIEHGNQLNRDLRVEVKIEALPDRMIIDVRDQGLQPLPQPQPVRRERADHRGWGLFLISHFASEVHATTTPQGNRLSLVLNRTPELPQGKNGVDHAP